MDPMTIGMMISGIGAIGGAVSQGQHASEQKKILQKQIKEDAERLRQEMEMAYGKNPVDYATAQSQNRTTGLRSQIDKDYLMNKARRDMRKERAQAKLNAFQNLQNDHARRRDFDLQEKQRWLRQPPAQRQDYDQASKMNLDKLIAQQFRNAPASQGVYR